MPTSVAAQPLVGKAYLVPMLPLAGYAIFLAESLVVELSPIWAALLLGWAAAATALAWWLSRGRPASVRLLDRLDRHSATVALVLILATVLVLVCVNVLQVRYFSLSVHAEDSAYYNQVLWNTLHGDFLSGNVQQERLFNPPVSTELALHVSPALLVALLPIYALFPSFLTLLVVRDVMLAAAAWPLFLLARDRMGGTAGVAAVTLYLANPAILAQGFQSFSLVLLAPLPFFLALRAFVDEKFGSFVLWTVVAMCVREDVAIAVAGFGLWALVGGRGFRWWAAGLGLSVAWWGITTLLIQPAFGRSGNNVFEMMSTGGRQGPLGIYEMFLLQPSSMLEGLREGGLHYLYRLLRSVGFVAILGWEALLALPGAMANLLLARVFYSGIDPIARFAVLPSCALVGAAVAIVTRAARRRPWDPRVFSLIVLLLLPSVSLVDGAKDAVQDGLLRTGVRNDRTALREAVDRIPDGVSVAAPTYALPALSKRPRLFTLQYLHMYPGAQPDYLLLDRNADRVTGNPELRSRYAALLDKVSRSGEYTTVWQGGEYFLLRRV
ncbi:MAG: DUF2079 domain-containing protein [Gaiellales bacterium]